ncbi:MAG: discoidin domain-containing protein, partial [Lachnospiraceae bacterium]|nr:discoidin domain-containing protein [Lachnospiraceae bacterium]
MKEKLRKTMKRTLCYLLALGMLGGSVLPAQAEGETSSGATLIAHYDFENVSGTTVPNTVDANTYAGTLNGAGASIQDETELGKSLNFSGTAASWMQIDSVVNTGANSYSISLWYKYDTTVSRGNKRVVLLQQNGGGRTLLTLTSDNKYHTYVNTSDVTGNTVIDPAKWQHVTFVNNAETDEVTWYVNGELDSTKSAGTGAVNELTALLIGCHKNGQDDPMYMRGLVDEISIYEGVIDADTAKAIYEENSALVEEEDGEGDTTEPVEITVDPNAVERTVDSSIFGINHRYAFNGYGSFDSYLMEVKDDFQELYEEAGFGSIRYPGGTISNLFNWKTTLDAVGRKDQIHGFYNNAGQGGIAPNFGIKEIADFADEVDSEIVYVYSLGRGSVQDAEDLIEFLNAEVGTNPNGGIDWAKVRSESGHPEPYNVRYFEIGNEMQQAGANGDGTWSQGYWLTAVASGSEAAYVEGGTATFTNQYAVCEEDWNQVASRSDGSANMVRYMRYANTNPKKYDENGNIVDDETFVAVVPDSVSVYVGSEQWTIVESFENSSAADKHVVVDYSTGALIFGDGVNGAIPASGQQINVSYSVERDGFVAISRAMKETTEKINKANKENNADAQHEAYVYSSYESQGFITKMANGGYNDLYDGLTIHPYSGTPSGTGTAFYDSAMQKAESTGVGHVQSYVNMLPEGKVPVISEYGIFRSTDALVRSQTHAIYIAKVLMEYVRLGSPYIQKHCLTDWYSSGADSLGPTQQAVIQVVAQNGADTKTGEGDFAFFSTPSARVFQMLNSSFGEEILASSFSKNETLSTGVKAYSALASKDKYDNYYVAVVNVDRENAKNMTLEVEGIDLTGADITIQMLSSDSIADENTLENPDNVAVETTTSVSEASTVTFEIPKHSFMVIKVATGVDKTALENAIEEANDLAAEEYTEESWNGANVEAAIETAEMVLNNDAATKEDVAAAVADLETAVGALKTITADKDALEAKIAEADALNESDYTGDSWSEMQRILATAKNVAAKENAKQEIVDTVLEDLTAAMEGLKTVIPVSEMTATAGDSQNGEGPEMVIDENESTVWHTNWYQGPNHDNHWLQIELADIYTVEEFHYLPRQSGSNGIITGYEVHVSLDGVTWDKVAEGTWASDAAWKKAEFEPVNAKYVKLVTTEAISDQSIVFASAAEVRLTGVKAGDEKPVDPPVVPVEEDEVIRLSGTTRYETGYKVADALKEELGVEKFEAVVVATGKNFADALAGSYLAVEKNAPIILTNGKADNIAQLHEYIAANVTAGGKVYILGGEAAVPASVAAIDG